MFGCAPCGSGSGAADYSLLSEMRQMTSPESGGAGSGEDGGRGFGGDRRADPDDSEEEEDSDAEFDAMMDGLDLASDPELQRIEAAQRAEMQKKADHLLAAQASGFGVHQAVPMQRHSQHWPGECTENMTIR